MTQRVIEQQKLINHLTLVLTTAHQEAAEAQEAVLSSQQTSEEEPVSTQVGSAWVDIPPSPFTRWCGKMARAALTSDEAARFGMQKPNGRKWRFLNPGSYTGDLLHIRYAGAEAFRDILVMALKDKSITLTSRIE